MLSQKETELIYKIKEKIVHNCKICKGQGRYIKNEIMFECQCMKNTMYILDLIKSNIPSDYWNLSLKGLKVEKDVKNEVQYYIEHIDNAIEKGIGLFFTCNTRGVGKTSLACEIAKEAIVKRYDVYYNLMQSIVSDKFTDNQEIIQKIKNSELIIIDEMDKVAMKKESNLSSQIENFLRELLSAGKTVIMCSNMSLKEIEEKIEIGSLIQRYVTIIEMEGTDYSLEKNKKLKLALDTEIDYLSENISNNANRHHKNKEAYYKKEYYKNYNL